MADPTSKAGYVVCTVEPVYILSVHTALFSQYLLHVRCSYQAALLTFELGVIIHFLSSLSQTTVQIVRT